MASLNQEELKALYDHIGYKPKNEKPAKTQDSVASGSETKTRAASSQQRSSGVIMRRVVYNEDSSYSDSAVNEPKEAKSGKTQSKSSKMYTFFIVKSPSSNIFRMNIYR